MGPSFRLVLDTNVLLSGLAFPRSIPGKIVSAWQSGAIDVVLSVFILDELRRVLPKLSHRHGLTEAEMDDLIDILSIQAEIVETATLLEPELRDVNDLPVLSTLVAARQSGHIDYLVTGDKDLLALSYRYPVVTPAAFWDAHGGL